MALGVATMGRHAPDQAGEQDNLRQKGVSLGVREAV